MYCEIFSRDFKFWVLEDGGNFAPEGNSWSSDAVDGRRQSGKTNFRGPDFRSHPESLLHLPADGHLGQAVQGQVSVAHR